MNCPRATYRLQFSKDFGFAEAARRVPYLARLGVSHLYASPYLKARPGSTHGYDIVDHNALNPELGTEEDFRAMLAALKANPRLKRRVKLISTLCAVFLPIGKLEKFTELYCGYGPRSRR